MKITAPKGTRDLLPEEIGAWQFIEAKFREICQLYGYQEIRIPTFEHTEVFSRGVGETTDVVKKEMYTFEDKAGRSMTLRPEGTAGIVRSFIENGMSSKPNPLRLFYEITAFRYENVQKGRYREFHQLGVETFGAEAPLADAEILALLNQFFVELGLENIGLEINSLGSPESRKVYREELLAFLRPRKDELCADCQSRMEENPLRVLDCKNEHCHEVTLEAPSILDSLDEKSAQDFEDLQKSLQNLGIDFEVNPRMVRGLDYYTETVFEFVSKNVGTQGTICGGGRYDNLVENMGGQKTPAVGFAIGEERLILELEAQGVLPEVDDTADVFIANVGEGTELAAQKLANDLRYRGMKAQYELTGRSLKAQMKFANKSNAKHLIVLGEDELKQGKFELRSLVDHNRPSIEVDMNSDEVWEEICDYLIAGREN